MEIPLAAGVDTTIAPPMDIILVYDQTESKQCKRDRFLEKLRSAGFVCRLYKSKHRNLHYVSLTAPWSALCKGAEQMNRKILPASSRSGEARDGAVAATPSRMGNLPTSFGEGRNRADQNRLFSPSQRSLVTWRILQGLRVDGCAESACADCKDELSTVGIDWLIDHNVFQEAFQLHEGHWKDDQTLRGGLYSRWASRWMRPQPLKEIQGYFGEKMALYFAWLGFYTFMLFPLSILGVGVFLYNLHRYRQDDRLVDVCGRMKEVVLCPLVDAPETLDAGTAARLSLLGEWCHHATTCALFDNSLTLPWALFTLLWSFVFRTAWRRYAPLLRGHLDDGEGAPSRIVSDDFAEMGSLAGARLSYARGLFTYGAVTLMACIVIAVISTISAYRIPLRAALRFGIRHETFGPLVALGAASLVNVLVIWLLNYVFRFVAVWLTHLQKPRTHTEFEQTLTVKLYLVHFASCYSSLVYIAFFEEKLTDQSLGCGPLGCFPALSVQLIIIMTVKQGAQTIYEYFAPSIERCLLSVSTCICNLFASSTPDETDTCPELDEDMARPLLNTPPLFLEYLELETQFGYIAMFGLAFPLAPLLALLSNVLEIRLDAQKFLRRYRRPTSSRGSADIGAWYKITGAINRLAVYSNAFVLAFCSDLVPRLYYGAVYGASHSTGYIDFSLAYFDTLTVNRDNVNSTWPETFRPANLHQRFCRYAQLRESPWYDPAWGPSVVAREKFWIFIFRFLFVLVFENSVALLEALANHLDRLQSRSRPKTLCSRYDYPAKNRGSTNTQWV